MSGVVIVRGGGGSRCRAKMFWTTAAAGAPSFKVSAQAGDRVDEVVTAHLLEAPVVRAVAPDEDRVHRRLRVHCPRTNGGQFPLP
mgnify:CR=1 FL=1